MYSSAGERTAPCVRLNMFTEQTLTYYLLSFLDQATPTTGLTVNFYQDHGLDTYQLLKDALLESAGFDAFYTIMSFHEALTSGKPELVSMLAPLNERLNLLFTDRWGNGLDYIPDILVTEGEEIDPIAYAPLYLEMTDEADSMLCYNDAFFDSSYFHPGNLRYAYFKPKHDGFYQAELPNITLPDGMDSDLSYELFLDGDFIAGGREQDQVLLASGNVYTIRFLNESLLSKWFGDNSNHCGSVSFQFVAIN